MTLLATKAETDEDPRTLALPTEALLGRTEDVSLPLPKHRTSMGALVAVVILFSLGAAVGMSSIAGFGSVLHRLGRFDGPWIGASAGGVIVAFLGYRLAFGGVVWDRATEDLTQVQRMGVVMAGFGAFIHRGGTAIDRYVMRVTGHDRRESDVRLAALQVLEMVPIALAATVAADVSLFPGGPGRPPMDFTLPWAIGPLAVAPVVLWAVHRFHASWREARGWRYWVGVILDAIWLVGSTLLLDRRRRLAFIGMAIFASGELFAVWAAMASFGYRMSMAGVILGYGVGYVISRRSAPLGGAGLIDVMLMIALAQAGAPLTAAIVGTFTYRFFNLWCSMPASLAALSSIRRVAGSFRPRQAL